MTAISIIVLSIVLFVVVSSWAREKIARQISGEQKVSDEEFLAAVPFATPEKALRIWAIISDQLDVPLHDIHPNDRFVEDLKAG